jgi:hypothetical protein
MKTFAQHQPLTDAELEGLAEFLQSCKGGKAMNVEQLDGFLPPSSRDRRGSAERILPRGLW